MTYHEMSSHKLLVYRYFHPSKQAQQMQRQRDMRADRTHCFLTAPKCKTLVLSNRIRDHGVCFLSSKKPAISCHPVMCRHPLFVAQCDQADNRRHRRTARQTDRRTGLTDGRHARSKSATCNSCEKLIISYRASDNCLCRLISNRC